MRIIAISGNTKSVQDVIAHHLQRTIPKEVFICRLDDKSRYVTAALTGTSVTDQLSCEKEQLVPTGFTDTLVALQQKIHLVLCQHLNPDIWVQALLNRLSWFPSERSMNSVIVIPDLQSQNEARLLKEHGAFLLRIESVKNGLQQDDPDVETDLKHYDGFDALVHDNGTMEELLEKINNLF